MLPANTTEEARVLAKPRSDRFTEIEEQYSGYEVYDRDGEKIGKVDDLFIDENDNPEYIGVKTGFFGTRSTLIPWDLARVDEGERRIVVQVDKATAKDGPSFDDDEEITPDYEERVRSHYGLSSAGGYEQRGAYGAYQYAGGSGERRRGAETRGEGLLAEERSGATGPGMRTGDVGHDREREGLRQPGGDLEDVDELRVQRTEEELRAGTREREAGGVHVRKRVRTEREQIRVPKRREEVHVERVPVEGREAPEAAFGEDEVFVPVTEEEVVVEKRPVVKEEIRMRKDVSHDEEVVEEDVRKEEVEIDDQTTRRGSLGSDPDVDDTRRRDR